MTKLKVDNRDIAKYIGQTPRNINLTYETQQKKEKHYLCLQLGTILNLKGIEPVDFLKFIDAYEVLHSSEMERLKIIEDKYNKMLGIVNG